MDNSIPISMQVQIIEQIVLFINPEVVRYLIRLVYMRNLIFRVWRDRREDL